MTKSTVTTARLEDIASDVAMQGYASEEEQQAMARELLAVREAQSKPVASTTKSNIDAVLGGVSTVIWPVRCFKGETHVDLYTVPPAPAVIQHVSQGYKLPDGYKLVPVELTAENGAKAALIGEFTEVKFINCPECFGDDECESCDGSGRIKVEVPVTWTTIKAIWKKGIEHFDSLAAAPTPTKAVPCGTDCATLNADRKTYGKAFRVVENDDDQD